MTETQQVHHYHHHIPEPISYGVEVSRTTRGHTYTVSVKGVMDPAILLREVKAITDQLEAAYPKEPTE